MRDDRSDRDRPLEGWKEIASYLQRDESTARRWEREEGLPVHRHGHVRRASVYAHGRELDAWRSARRPQAPNPPSGPRLRKIWVNAAIAILILLARGDGFRPAAEADDHRAGMRTVEMCARCDWTGSVSPDGRSISETDWNTYNVGLRDFATGELRLLTDTGSLRDGIGAEHRHVFSPDGGSLAFGWWNQRSELRRISVDEESGKPTLLYADDDLTRIQAEGWSTSGQILVKAIRSDWTTLLGFVPAEGGQLQVVKTLPYADTSVRLSSGGRWIAYDVPSKDHAPSRDVYLLAADGSREALVSGHPANDYVVGVTAGSDAVLFASNRTGSYGLWAAEILENGTTGQPRLIQRDTGAIYPLTITPDGALYHAHAIGAVDVFTGEIDFESGRIVAGPKLVSGRLQGANRGPLWAPDGSFMVYRSTDSPRLDFMGRATRVVVRSWPAGDERELVPDGIEISPYYAMHLSPDGKRLMLLALDDRERWGVYALKLETAEVELLMRQPPDESLRFAGWGADGITWFYVLSLEDGGTTHSIYRMDPGANRGRRIHSISDRGRLGKIMSPKLSPRRDLLAFRVLGGQEVWVLPLEGGDAVKVYESPEGTWPASLAWAPEGDALVMAVMAPSSPEHRGIHRVPIDGGPAVRVEPLGANVRDISVHPDGRTVLYHDGRGDVRIWKLENYWSPARKSAAAG